MIQGKVKLFLAGLVCVLSLLGCLVVNIYDPVPNQIEGFREKFNHSVNKLDQTLERAIRQIRSSGSIQEMKLLNPEEGIVHHYHRDTLVFWNSNLLPLGRFADIQYPSNGLVHLQNGWYYAKMANYRNHVVCASFLIKREYPYENQELINRFAEQFRLDPSVAISLEENEGFAVFDRHGKYVFSLVTSSNQHDGIIKTQWLLLLYLWTIVWLLMVVWLLFIKVNYTSKWIFPLLIVVIKIIILHYGPLTFNTGSAMLDPSIFAMNSWFPNFFEYLTNVAVIVLFSFMVMQLIEQLRPGKVDSGILLCISLLFWFIPRNLCEGLVENSSIQFSVDRLFSLNLYTVLGILSIALLFYTFLKLVIFSIRRCIKAQWKAKGTVVILIMCWLGISFKIGNTEQLFIVCECIILALLLVVVWKSYHNTPFLKLASSFFFFSMATLVITILLVHFNNGKEQTTQKLYAEKLASEEAVLTELEYQKIKAKLLNDPVLLMLSSGKENNLSTNEFEDGLERRVFNGFWERYETNFYLFDGNNNNVLVSTGESDESEFNNLTEIVEKHGTASSIDSFIYVIKDLTDQYSFIIRQPFRANNKEERILMVTLRSKKIPEEIGFPRLLISAGSYALQHLERYSIARYHSGKLIASYGAFDFPYRSMAIQYWERDRQGFRQKSGYQHCIIRSGAQDLIILSTTSPNLFNLMSSFCYLFLFFGILLLPQWIIRTKSISWSRSLPLASRFQVILIGMVSLSLILFGWGSTSYIGRQYDQFSEAVIADKLGAIQSEVTPKLSNLSKISLEEQGRPMSMFLEKISEIYKTDVNLYDSKGFLVASSRPKIYRLGLIGDQMNREVLREFNSETAGRSIRQEKIGELSYTSVYKPCFNKRGHLLGYINLQHFGKQREQEEQVEGVLTSVINIFMVLIALVLVTMLFITNWLTRPLRRLKENLLKSRFGASNEPLYYDRNDEIGELIKAYNTKLGELEFAASQLAKSERESAWREMAKQVAHEIKNPLTPMKLSVQQLERSFDPQDPSSVSKIQRVSQSLVEQIDALTRIANEFAVFANMPKPVMRDIELASLISNVVHVFRDSSPITITFQHTTTKAIVRADKDQMIRVFNNIIQNALQSISKEEEGRVDIDLIEEDEHVLITVKDNGEGMDEEVQKRLFTPHFTTKSKGSGLGLAMVKQIIENHRGTISFHSGLGLGSTFSILIPRKLESDSVD